MPVEIVIEDPEWDEQALRGAVQDAWSVLAPRFDLDAWDCTLLACDDARIAVLNGDFRGKARATNVLSWPSAERGAQSPGKAPTPPVADGFGDCHLGDIALALQTCTAEAASEGLALRAHLTHLVLHGVLHLLGYDHIDEDDADLMETIETDLLAQLGLHDPYEMGAKA